MKKTLFSILLCLILIFTGPDLVFSEEDYFKLQAIAAESNQNHFQEQTSSENLGNILDALHDVENLTVKIYPGGAILQGELLSPDDMRKVIQLGTRVEGLINLCTLHSKALDLAAQYLNKILRENHISNMEFSVLGKSLFLTGTFSATGDVDRIKKICKTLNIPMIDGTRQATADSRMVLFEVSFTEVNKDAFESFGVKWPVSTDMSDPTGIRVGNLKPAQNLEVVINHLVYEGKARIISKPRLTCGSGQEASFQAGGELPIPKTDSEGRLTITWKPYGIILQIAPKLDPDGTIHTRIRSEVSMVDQANAVDGIPGILTRRVDTHLSLSQGQTIVLSGLVHSDDAERVTKIPFFGDIPILGEIFKSRNFQKKETELVVFLTPLKFENMKNKPSASLLISGEPEPVSIMTH